MNTHRRTLLSAGAVFLIATVSGCASAPIQSYRLAVIPGATTNNATLKLGVRSIDIPGYLGQSGIAKPSSDYQFSLFTNDVWAEPLDAMLQDVMVQELALRLPESTAVASGGSIHSSADVLIEANVLRFDPDSSGRIILTVQIAIKSGQDYQPWLVQTFTSSAAPAGPLVADTVATMSTLWAGLADQLAVLTAAQWNIHAPG